MISFPLSSNHIVSMTTLQDTTRKNMRSSQIKVMLERNGSKQRGGEKYLIKSNHNKNKSNVMNRQAIKDRETIPQGSQDKVSVKEPATLEMLVEKEIVLKP